MKNKPLKSKVEHRKWERIYEDEFTISVWKYDSRKSEINPYEVETKYKKESDINSKTRKKRL